MTTKTIGIIQVKCGAGRSTVSTNLAGELSKLGKNGYGEQWNGKYDLSRPTLDLPMVAAQTGRQAALATGPSSQASAA